jgi:hypothetical protein
MSRVPLRPSAGFLLVAFSYTLLVVTLAWGFSTPELDRVWRIMQSMQRRDFTEIAPKDVQILKTALQHYPALPRAFIGRAPIGFVEPTRAGWMSHPRPHLLTSTHSQHKLALNVECRAPANAFPVSVVLERESARQEIRFSTSGLQHVDLPLASPSKPEWIPVTIRSSAGGPGGESPQIKLDVQGQSGNGEAS